MKKKILDIDTEIKVGIIGVCSIAKDYRLCWEINRLLNLKLKRYGRKGLKYLSLEEKYKTGTNINDKFSSKTSIFAFTDKGKGLTYKLMQNTNPHGEKLVPEQKQVDYFMLISGQGYDKEKDRLISELRGLEIVLTTFEMNTNAIKSRLNVFIND